ncbi:hypothetical protein ACJX0J_039103, partial [Zea mays]
LITDTNFSFYLQKHIKASTRTSRSVSVSHATHTTMQGHHHGRSADDEADRDRLTTSLYLGAISMPNDVSIQNMKKCDILHFSNFDLMLHLGAFALEIKSSMPNDVSIQNMKKIRQNFDLMLHLGAFALEIKRL